MMNQPTEAWTSDQAYEPFIGRWSRKIAPQFLRWLPATPPATWCDVGCGTGALSQSILATENPTQVVGVEPSAEYLAAARRGAAGRPFTGALGSAASIPAVAEEFDRVVAALVLNFVPEPAAALAEMRRVCRPGGIVAAYVWDYAEGMQLLRTFWDAATALDPGAAALDEAQRFPLCRPDPLRELFGTAGLLDVEVAAIETPTVFTDFADLWRPFLGGQGPAPGYCAGLTEERRNALRERLRHTLPVQGDGSIPLTARAWAVRGVVPAPS